MRSFPALPLARLAPARCAVVGAALGAALTLSAPAAQAQTPATLDKVKASGTITVAYRESSIPFSYLDGEGKPTGFGWEICGRIVENVKKATGRSDLKVATQAVTSNNRIPLMVNGTIDIECGSTTNNSARQQQVDFAINYFYTGTRLLVKAGSPVKNYGDLKGRKAVSTTGTTNFQVMRRVSAERGLNFELMGAKDHAESLLLVQQGRADAFGMDDILLYGLKASAANPAEFEVVGDALQVEPYAIMLRKDDPSFKALVDGVLARLMDSGEFERLYTRWFQQPIPPRGVNLNAPMPTELRDNLKAKSDKPAT